MRHVKAAKRWDVMPPDCLMAAIDAAIAKSCQEEITEAAWYERKQQPVPVPLPTKSPAPAVFAEEYKTWLGWLNAGL